MNIVLIGMPGAGKSTLGVLLAKALGMQFVDIDLIIQQQEGRLLQEILDQEGIDAFLAIESAVLSGLSLDNTVIATGGSAVYATTAMQKLQKSAMIVYIQVPYADIQRRITNITSRGIVLKPNATLQSTYAERIVLYQKYSDATVDCAHGDIERCVQALLSAIQQGKTIQAPL